MAGRYGDVAARAAGRRAGTAGCAPAHAGGGLAAVRRRGTEDGDAPRGRGPALRREKLLALLLTLGLDRDALAYDAPWGFEVDANEPAVRCARTRAPPRPLQANSGVLGVDRGESRRCPGREPCSYGGVPAGAFCWASRAAWFSALTRGAARSGTKLAVCVHRSRT